MTQVIGDKCSESRQVPRSPLTGSAEGGSEEGEGQEHERPPQSSGGSVEGKGSAPTAGPAAAQTAAGGGRSQALMAKLRK